MKRLILPLIFITLTPLVGQSLLEGDFWISADLLGYASYYEEGWLLPLNQETTDRDRDIFRVILEDARYIFSAMLNGWDVRYRPADPALEVDEFYEISLRSEIPWGDPRLKPDRTWQEGQRYGLHAYYRMDEREQTRRQSNLSNRYQDGGGRGSGPPFGENPRREALEEAVKQSLRNHLQPRYRNRPREISGRVYLRKMPLYSQGPDSYICQILVKLDLNPIVQYPLDQ